MTQLEKNTVPASNQLKEYERIFYINKEGKGKRILFAGNSITRHGYKAEIGWYGDWGMAASSKDKDYLHLLANKAPVIADDSVFCVCQSAIWERGYMEKDYSFDVFEPARDFNADIIVMRIMENVPSKDFAPEAFITAYKKFLDFLNGTGKAQVILTTSFWKHPGDANIIQIAEERGYQYIDLGELGEDESMKAIGLFKHSGVANHPSDKGMAAIADAIFEKMDY